MQTNDAAGKTISIGSRVTLPTLGVVAMQGNANGDFLVVAPLGDDDKPLAGAQPITVKAALTSVQV